MIIKIERPLSILLSFVLILGLILGVTFTAMAATSDDIFTFTYTGQVQTFIAPADGYYKLEAWGAKGGAVDGRHWQDGVGGYGGYSTGVIHLTEDTALKVYVGGDGGHDGDAGGWNGGGTGAIGVVNQQKQVGVAGGGATDFRISGDTLYHRILVAGGGGGGVHFSNGYMNKQWTYAATKGGAGGGATGKQSPAWMTVLGGGGGTQTSGGAAGPGKTTNGNVGTFGQGGNSPGGDAPGGGGGGGWFGGGSGGSGPSAPGVQKASGGGGGSGFVYIGGTPIEGYQVESKYALMEASTVDGDTVQRWGHGQAKVTRLRWNVTFDGNGGTVSKSAEKAYVTRTSGESTYIADFTIPAETAAQVSAARDNYIFSGWSTRPDGLGDGSTTTAFCNIELTSDTTLYAKWTLVCTDAQKPKAIDGLVYNEDDQELVTAPESLPTGYSTVQYSMDGGTTWSTEIPKGRDARDTSDPYVIKVQYVTNDGQTFANGDDIPVTIGQQAAPTTLTNEQKPTAKENLVYTSQPQELVTAPSELPEGYIEIQYALGKDATNPPSSGWSTAIPTATDGGIYFTWYKIVGNANYNDTEPVCLTVEIAFTVTFDPNGGSGNMNPVRIRGTYKLPANEFTAPEGHVFGRWLIGETPQQANDQIIVKSNLTVKTVWITTEEGLVSKLVKVEVIPLTDNSDIPEELRGLNLTVQEIRQTLYAKLFAIGSAVSQNQTKLYDVELVVSNDGGKTWVPATIDNFPTGGLEVLLGYPEGTGPNGWVFGVSHMFTQTVPRLGTEAGKTETPPVTKTPNGLRVKLKGLSPVMISWQKEEVNPDSLPPTGDKSNVLIYALIGALAVTGIVFLAKRKKV